MSKFETIDLTNAPAPHTGKSPGWVKIAVPVIGTLAGYAIIFAACEALKAFL